MTRVASLGMYDFSWLAHENDALWAALRRRAGIADAPGALDRGRPLEAVLRDPTLLFGQTCGYPLMTALRGVVRPVATPVYDLPGCAGGRHCSFVIVRSDDPAASLTDLRGRRAALNGFDSNSGMNLLRAAVAPLAENGRFFASVTVTGAHLNSLAAVRNGAADTAAIDCVTYGLAARHIPALVAGIRVLAETPGSPALPFVTAASTSDTEVAILRAALSACLPWPGLALTGVQWLDTPAYGEVLDLERSAIAAGYPRLA